MNQPPYDSGQEPTQPIPVTPAAAPVPPRPIPGGGFVPIFGNVPMYLLSRLLAFGVDVAAIAFAIAAFLFSATERGFLTLAGRSENGFATLAGIALGAAILFAFLCESLFGASLGKAIFGLRVHRSAGGHAGVARIFARYLLRPIDLLAIGPLLALVTPRHQRLGDFLGGTVVSRYRFGPLASIVGIGLLVAVAYAQAVFGGGLTTAVDLAAESANYGPDLVAKTAAVVGILIPHPAPVDSLPVAAPGSSASPAAVATAEPSNQPSPAASDEPSPAASPDPAVATDAPADPTPEPSVERI